MIKLTEKGEAVFEVVRDYSSNELAAIQSIAYERITYANFEYVAALPKETLHKLASKGVIKGE